MLAVDRGMRFADYLDFFKFGSTYSNSTLKKEEGKEEKGEGEEEGGEANTLTLPSKRNFIIVEHSRMPSDADAADGPPEGVKGLRSRRLGQTLADRSLSILVSKSGSRLHRLCQ